MVHLVLLGFWFWIARIENIKALSLLDALSINSGRFGGGGVVVGLWPGFALEFSLALCCQLR